MKYKGMPRPEAKAKEPSLDTGNDINRKNRTLETYVELKQQSDCIYNTLRYTEKNMSSFLFDLSNKHIHRVILIGCGDSLFVGYCLELLIEKLIGCECQSYDAFEFFMHRSNTVDEHTVIIGQSASGTTTSVLGALKHAHMKKSYTIGISNTANAEILHIADFGLLIQANRIGWPTQASTSAISAIAFLFASLAIKLNINTSFAEKVLKEISTIPKKITKAINDNETNIKVKTHDFESSFYFQATGSGSLYGAAEIAAAKLKELCPVHAAAYPIEEFHHYRSLKKADPLLLFIQRGKIEKKEIDTALVGAYDEGKIITIGSSIPEEIKKVSDLVCIVPETLTELQPLVSVTCAHLFAYYVAIAKFDADIGYPSEGKD